MKCFMPGQDRGDHIGRFDYMVIVWKRSVNDILKRRNCLCVLVSYTKKNQAP